MIVFLMEQGQIPGQSYRQLLYACVFQCSASAKSQELLVRALNVAMEFQSPGHVSPFFVFWGSFFLSVCSCVFCVVRVWVCFLVGEFLFHCCGLIFPSSLINEINTQLSCVRETKSTKCQNNSGICSCLLLLLHFILSKMMEAGFWAAMSCSLLVPLPLIYS